MQRNLRPRMIAVSLIALIGMVLVPACSQSDSYKKHQPEQHREPHERSETSLDELTEPIERSEDYGEELNQKVQNLRSAAVQNLPVQDIRWEYTPSDRDILNIWNGFQAIYVETRHRESGEIQLFSIDRRSGTPNWVFTLRGPLDYAPVQVSGLPQESEQIAGQIEELENESSRLQEQPEPDLDRLQEIRTELDQLEAQQQTLLEEDRLYLVSGTTLTVLERRFGNFLEERSLSFSPSARPAASQDYVAIPSYSQNRVHFLDPESLRSETTYAPREAVEAAPAYADNRFLIGSLDDTLHLWSGGEIPWVIETDGDITIPPAIGENHYFVASEDMKIYGIDSTVGNVDWSYHPESTIRGEMTVSPPHLFARDREEDLHAVHIDSGEGAWVQPNLHEVIMRSGDRVYAANKKEKSLVALNGSSGEIQDRYSYDAFDFILPATGQSPSDLFIFATEDGTIMAAHEDIVEGF